MNRRQSDHRAATARPANEFSIGGSGIATALELLEEQAPSRELGQYLAELRQRFDDADERDDVPEFIRPYLIPVP